MARATSGLSRVRRCKAREAKARANQQADSVDGRGAEGGGKF